MVTSIAIFLFLNLRMPRKHRFADLFASCVILIRDAPQIVSTSLNFIKSFTG